MTRRRGSWHWRSARSSAIVLFGNGWRETPDGWVSGGWDWSDLLVHVAIGSSILHGNFPPEVPYFAGVPLTYHWFADFHGAIAATASGLDLIPVYFATSALFAGVLALVVWALALRLTGDRRVALVATILVCIGGGMGWIRLVLDVVGGQGDIGTLITQHPYDNNWEDALAVLPDRIRAGHRLLPPPRDDPRTPGARVGRAARRVVPRTPAGRRPAGRDPGGAPRAVPLLCVPGDVPHRRAVRARDGGLASADGRSRRAPVPRAGRAGHPVRRRCGLPAGRHRGVPIRARLGRGALQRGSARGPVLLRDEPGRAVRPRDPRGVHRHATCRRAGSWSPGWSCSSSSRTWSCSARSNST